MGTYLLQLAADSYNYLTAAGRWFFVALSFLAVGSQAQVLGPIVEPSEALVYGVSVEAIEEKPDEKWCVVLQYPKANMILNGLLHRDTELSIIAKDKKRVELSASLTSEEVSGEDGVLRAKFCGIRETIERTKVEILFANDEFIEDLDSPSSLIGGDYTWLTIRKFGSVLP